MLVVQSAPAAVPPWIERCLASAAAWAAGAGFAYERLGDELFDFVPPSFAGLPRLARTDLARLALLRSRLDEGHDAVLWLDADVLVFDDSAIVLPAAELAACSEVWVTTAGEGALRALSYVCNAALCARGPGAGLDWLLAATVERASDLSAPVQDRSLGPDLLTRLDRAGPRLARLGGVGLCSPLVVGDLAAGGGPALSLFRETVGAPLGALNLCASTGLGDDVFAAAVEALSSGRHGLH